MKKLFVIVTLLIAISSSVYADASGWYKNQCMGWPFYKYKFNAWGKNSQMKYKLRKYVVYPNYSGYLYSGLWWTGTESNHPNLGLGSGWEMVNVQWEQVNYKSDGVCYQHNRDADADAITYRNYIDVGWKVTRGWAKYHPSPNTGLEIVSIYTNDARLKSAGSEGFGNKIIPEAANLTGFSSVEVRSVVHIDSNVVYVDSISGFLGIATESNFESILKFQILEVKDTSQQDTIFNIAEYNLIDEGYLRITSEGVEKVGIVGAFVDTVVSYSDDTTSLSGIRCVIVNQAFSYELPEEVNPEEVVVTMVADGGLRYDVFEDREDTDLNTLHVSVAPNPTTTSTIVSVVSEMDDVFNLKIIAVSNGSQVYSQSRQEIEAAETLTYNVDCTRFPSTGTYLVIVTGNDDIPVATSIVYQ